MLRPRADLSFDGFTLTVDHCVWSDDAVWRRVGINHLEFHGSHSSAHEEYIAFVKWPVCLKEVWLQVDIKQVATTQS